MKHPKMYCSLLVLLFAGLCLSAQDKVYYTKNKIDNWKVIDISEGYLKAIDVRNPDIACSASHSNVLFIFNSRGNFLVIPKLYEDPIKSQLYAAHFLEYNNNGFQRADRIITAGNNIITCKIESEKEQGIVYAIGNKEFLIPKTDIAVLIYKDGAHKLMTTADKAYKVLRAVQDEYNASFIAVRAEKTTGNQAKAIVTVPSVRQKQDTAQMQPVENGKKIAVQSSVKQSDGIDSRYAAGKMPGVDSSLVKNAVFRQKNAGAETKVLDAATVSLLQEKAVLNIKELETYIKIISDKQSDPDRIGKAVDQAVSLFASEDSRIEVSSVSRIEPQLFSVRAYLNRLGLMKYSKVMVEWYNVQYVSKVRKNPDGTYSGLIEFEQRFTGMSGDRKIYQDVTRKTIEIVLKSYYKKSSGETKLEWDVFLGDIGITVTKSA